MKCEDFAVIQVYYRHIVETDHYEQCIKIHFHLKKRTKDLSSKKCKIA